MPIANVFQDPSSGGTTIITTATGGKKLVASIDFSLAANSSINLSADGNYTFTTTATSSVATLTGRLKNIGNNSGGSWAVSSGKLVGNTPSTVTSPWGKMYWSSVHAPFLAFDMRQFAEVAADTGLEKWSVICEIEIDPMFTYSSGTWTSTCGIYQWLQAGVAQGMDAYWAGSQTSPSRWFGALHRSESATATSASAWPYGMSFQMGWGAASSSHMTGVLSAYALNTTAPYNTVSTTPISKYGASWSNRHASNYFYNGSALIKYFNGPNDPISGNGSAYTNWDPAANTNTGAFIQSATNDVWGYVMMSRSTGSGATSTKINKINFYIVENL